MNFLHKMDYNYTKAKFYILFPYYIKYNQYRCHDPLNISIDDMKKKIKDHLQKLKNTKEKDMEKWIQNLDNCLQARTSYTRFCAVIDAGKQNKYQVPQHIKQQLEKSIKAGKQLKKSLVNTKFPIQTLIAKKDILKQYKIVTTDMVSFQDTVNRCQQWIKKQQQFQQKYLQIFQNGNFAIKQSPQKIQFKKIQQLYNEYNNLPISHKNFEQTTKKLYVQTTELLQKMPTFNKIVKTRTSKQITASKIPYNKMRTYLESIQKYQVVHEEFEAFEKNMRESMQLLERVSMFLEDSHSEKNSKILNNYLKLINDVQIQNNVQKLLKDKLQYNQIIDRIKKQLSNPGKVQSVKQALSKLREKGIKVQDSGYQEKIMLYLGWYQSQQKLRQVKTEPNNIELIQKQLQIKRKLVDATGFWDQLESAKKQLNISEDSFDDAYSKLEKYKQNVKSIQQILADPEPVLEDMIVILKNCLIEGLTFPQFQQLYEMVIKYFITLAKIHFLLKINPENINPQQEAQLFFTSLESQKIVTVTVYQNELKDLKSKQGADKLLYQIDETPFPRYMKQCSLFKDFMNKGEQWADKVRQLIKDFRENGQTIDIKELEQSRYFLHSKAIKQEIGKVQFIMKWREKIGKKFDDDKAKIFEEEDQEFLSKLQKDLAHYESLQANNPTQKSPFKSFFLQYCRDNSKMIERILDLMVGKSQLDNVCKLSQMNKFYREIQKQIQRHKIDDKKIFELKEAFHEQIMQADEWKQKFHMVKRFEKKKMLKMDSLNNEEQGQQDAQNYQKNGLFVGQIPNEHTPDHISKKKYQIKNGQFTWYFKFLIMMLEFSKGYRLRFCLEEMQKLKNSLAQIHKFCTHYSNTFQKKYPFDYQLTSLKSQGAKIQIFIRQCWLLQKKYSYVQSWKILADSVLDSVPIVKMELKARKPAELIAVLQKKKMQTQQASKNTGKQRVNEQFTQKRERKPNTLYNNDDIALLVDDNIGAKSKKRKKGNNDGQYRNTSVASQSKKNVKSQIEEIERAQALLKGQGSQVLFSSEEANQQYCICRNGELNENSTMVQCEGNCKQWFHIQCIGVKKHQIKGDYSYLCIGCSTLYSDIEPHGSFYWDYRSKISEYALDQIMQQGNNLGVQTQQFRKIQIVYKKMLGWKKKVQDILQNIIRDDMLGKSLFSYSSQLYELYLLSLWLPTFHPEANTIRKLLLYSRQSL